MAKIAALTVQTAKFADFAITGYQKTMLQPDGTGINVPLKGSVVASNPASLPVFVNASAMFNYVGTSTNSSASYTVTLTRVRGGKVLGSKSGGFSGNGSKHGGAQFSFPDAGALPGDTYSAVAAYSAAGGAEGGSISADLPNCWISALFVKK
jgi:hypothetical protein